MIFKSVFLASVLASVLAACGEAENKSSQLSSTFDASYIVQIKGDQETQAILDGLEPTANIVYQASKKGRGCGESNLVQLPYAPWWPHSVYQPALQRMTVMLERKGSSLFLKAADRSLEACRFEILHIQLSGKSILNKGPRIRFDRKARYGEHSASCEINDAQDMFACGEVVIDPEEKNSTILLGLVSSLPGL